jgi:saccharopine dehydrogenase-like NADP-dependent oxidoreductase
MMRTTAFPASIIAQMTAKGDVKMRGATPQEKAIDAEIFVAELARRNIKVQSSRFKVQSRNKLTLNLEL